ncbi:MAG: hypothetical protein A2842_00085 [Candidatus Wildermuthbacteria bacterium RIFCSPHIGHO2_01_FULL_48_25]|uniref:Yeast cell wall synthesis Kre9/Knh1-like N-terminal domain-containing protein n=1 Tax=Candidatus Wildermuthbacteria bacterium RIFCSPLOWO2_01_FULL_48_16 TaxID=1802461 RepID=A0A1G2RLL1_9BACT|nr:MAG: hypothetical protein A2842_00085 [Candidatus Wildermuthbacteria bacterium RIFCSPHIGHO2_01_FULL_48_25]OHA68679.1 MAG: hypothetical protein A3J57_00925 [Candidatus Wildermuthbacteria bacterium RIFCSPHIGHO2_02_FULL_49_12b]OHA73734.1 MAG: hypothetical protein A3B24_02935 [Candidatus Wildermuthbacteria bacterium RIFCSPLOWO2_01_FULL_48_16]
MNFPKIIFAASIIAVFAFAVPSADALTDEEIKALIMQLQEQIAQLQKQLAETEPQAWCHTFDINMKIGGTGSEVMALQTALEKEGLYTVFEGQEFALFDESLASAVVGFQEKYKSEILAPFRLAHGTGFVGSSTRAKLNRLYACSATQATPAPTPIPTPVPTPTPTPPTGSQPSLTVRSPNGGEELFDGVGYPITWHTGGYARISIYLDKPDPTVASKIIANNVANTGSYHWTIANVDRGSYKIRVCEYRDSSLPYAAVECDMSDGYFNIAKASAAAAPEMVYPVNGQVLNHGFPNQYIFKAKPVAGARYLFGFFQDGAMVYENWRDNQQLSSNGEFIITPSNSFYSKLKEGNAQVWVRAWLNNQWSEARVITIKLVSQTSTIPSTQPSITVSPLNPNGEILQKGTTRYVNLKFSPSVPLGGFVVNLIPATTDTYAVAHLKTCGTASDYIADSVVPPNVSWQWKVGYDVDGKEIPNDSYRVLVYDCGSKNDSVWTGSVASAKSSVFSIVSATTTTPSITVLSPNGGEQLQKGATQTITWSSSNVSQVYIKLRKGTDTYHGTEGAVSDIISNTGSYQWTIPTTLPDGSDYSIRVVDSAGTISDDSNSDFSIAIPSITVLSPNGGEQLQIGSTYRIRWSSAGMYNVKIYIVNDTNTGSGSTNYVIPYNNGWSASTGFYDWTITSQQLPVGTSNERYKIRIDSNENSSIFDSSDGYFTIVGAEVSAPSIKILSPNGGENWKIGETRDITWSYSGPASKTVQIELALPAADGPIITSNVAASAQRYSWLIPDIDVSSLSEYRVIIREPAPTYTLLDSSDSYFSIGEPPYITSVSPTSGTSNDMITVYGSDLVDTPAVAVTIEFLKNGVVKGSQSSGISTRFDGLSLKFQLSGLFVENAETGAYQIRVVNSNGTSNAVNFTITEASSQPSLTVLAPNGGGLLFPGAAEVTWKSTGISADQPINIISLVGVDGTEWHLKYDAPNDGYEVVNLPSFDKSGSFKIKLETSVNKQQVIDLSDTYFNLIPPVSSLKNIEDQTASIADAVSKLLESLKGFTP